MSRLREDYLVIVVDLLSLPHPLSLSLQAYFYRFGLISLPALVKFLRDHLVGSHLIRAPSKRLADRSRLSDRDRVVWPSRHQ